MPFNYNKAAFEKNDGKSKIGALRAETINQKAVQPMILLSVDFEFLPTALFVLISYRLLLSFIRLYSLVFFSFRAKNGILRP